MKQPNSKFTAYQKLMILVIALIQFTVVLDFLIMAPLGNEFIKTLHLDTGEFGLAVSVYAFSAGASGILAAGIADKYPRKTLLLVTYTGFTLSTLLCGVANSYGLLVAGRILAGLFGGIVASTSMTFIADVFSFGQRGRVVGFVQMSFAACQLIGLPAGVYLSFNYGWNMAFLMIAVLCIGVLFLIAKALRPVEREKRDAVHPFWHLVNTIKRREYWLPYGTTILLIVPAYLFFPFTAQFLVNNVKIHQSDLGFVYTLVGIFSLVFLPVIGKASDKYGKWQTFVAGSIISILMMAVYINFSNTPVWMICLVSAVMYVGLLSRSIPSTALMTAVPEGSDRGAFMSINASMQQIGGGLATMAGGYVVTWKNGELVHFEVLGYICMAAMGICCISLFYIYRAIVRREVLKEINKRLQAPSKPLTGGSEKLAHEQAVN